MTEGLIKDIFPSKVCEKLFFLYRRRLQGRLNWDILIVGDLQ